MKDKQRSTSQVEDKHTPGQWKATKFGSIEYKDGILGEAYDFNPGFDAMESEKLPHMANARLMAAAPELLEFVQYVANGIPVWDDPDSLEVSVYHLEKRAKRLVSKIEGDE